ncbi:MAG TPA: hypothetical protein DHV31_02400 [Clostridiales bacterium]|nr:hypothetical protein [Clostridiales bacterium]
MELETKTITKKRSLALQVLAYALLRKRARLLVRATKQSKAAGDALLCELPGVFCAELCFGKASVRLIKEADRFRIQKKSEKSANILKIIFKDRAAMAEVCLNKVPLQKTFCEGRIAEIGPFNRFAVFARINAEADKLKAQK